MQELKSDGYTNLSKSFINHQKLISKINLILRKTTSAPDHLGAWRYR